MDAYPSYKFDYIGMGFKYDSLGDDGFSRVTEIISDRCAAFSAGIQEGDLMLEANGQTTKGKTIKQISELMAVNPLKIKVRRKGSAATATLQITADSVFNRSYSNPVIYAALLLTPETVNNPELVLFKNGDQLENKYLKYYRNAIKAKLEDMNSYCILETHSRKIKRCKYNLFFTRWFV